jgi:hypothetical protein
MLLKKESTRFVESIPAVSSESYLRRLSGMMKSRADVAIKITGLETGPMTFARLPVRGRNDLVFPIRFPIGFRL